MEVRDGELVVPNRSGHSDFAGGRQHKRGRRGFLSGPMPGAAKNARSISVEPQLIPAFPGVLATTQLLRGQRKTVLNVEAMIVSGNSAPPNLGMGIDVNG